MNDLKHHKGRIDFSCSDPLLERGFFWAKAMALAYVREGDPVGEWYEAALPGRQAFCMRDVAHQAVGAQILGLDSHNKNMLGQFAGNIAESRDFCSFWEITGDGLPASVDYTDDSDFWYNLPAGFDLLQTCWKLFQWTGDRAYLDSPVFNNFYRTTVTDFIRVWDKNNDGIPERSEPGTRRGIPTYDERPACANALFASDLLAVQALAFDAYASIHRLKGNTHLYEKYAGKAAALREYFDRDWWDDEHQIFHAMQFSDGQFESPADIARESAIFPLYDNLIADPAKAARMLDVLADARSDFVEYLTYLPEIFYQYRLNEAAYQQLLKLTDPELPRREYPEVAFAVIAALTAGLMGIQPAADREAIVTASRLPNAVPSARMDHVPVFGGEICVRHIANRVTLLTIRTGGQILWQPEFDGVVRTFLVDGISVRPTMASRSDGSPYASACVPLPDGCTVSVEIEREP